MNANFCQHLGVKTWAFGGRKGAQVNEIEKEGKVRGREEDRNAQLTSEGFSCVLHSLTEAFL